MQCKICGISDIDYKGRWYDNGIYGRALCSKQCYSDWYDVWNKTITKDNNRNIAYQGWKKRNKK